MRPASHNDIKRPCKNNLEPFKQVLDAVNSKYVAKHTFPPVYKRFLAACFLYSKLALHSNLKIDQKPLASFKFTARSAVANLDNK